MASKYEQEKERRRQEKEAQKKPNIVQQKIQEGLDKAGITNKQNREDYKNNGYDVQTDQTRTNPATPGIVAEEQATPTKEAPLGATWQERIKNATASDDDMRTAYEAYKKGEYTPGPKTMEEFQKMGLMEQPSNEQPTEVAQPQEQAEQNQPVEENQEATPDTDTPAPAEPAGDNPADAPAVEEQVQEDTQEVQEELQSKTDDELKAYLADIDKSLNTNDEAKAKMAGIFEAYKNGDIDKNQRNYFLADAIARFANNIGEIQDAKNQNALWSSITSGNQKSANVDLSPNEWQNFLKTDWQEAQKRKNEAKSKATMEKVQNDMDALRKAGQDKYMYNDFPTMVKNSEYMKLPDEERTKVAQMIAISNGAPYNADQLGNVSDILGNAKVGNAIGDLTVQAMKDNHDVVQANLKLQNIKNMYAEQQEQLDIQLKQGAIDEQSYNKQMAELLRESQKIENEIAKATKDIKISKEQAELINTKYAKAKFHLTGKIPGVGEAGAEVDGATLVNAGMDITDAIKKGLVK